MGLMFIDQRFDPKQKKETAIAASFKVISMIDQKSYFAGIMSIITDRLYERSSGYWFAYGAVF